jgi:hypothetical protein
VKDLDDSLKINPENEHLKMETEDRFDHRVDSDRTNHMSHLIL